MRAALLLAVVLCACRAPLESGGSRDLLSALDDVELRSDSLDLPFLLVRHAGAQGDWRPAEGTRAAPILWNGGPAASLELPLASSLATDFRLRLRRHPGASPQLAVVVALNGRSLGTVLPRLSDTEFRFQVPASAILPGASVLTLSALSRRTKGRLFALTGLEVRPGGSPEALVAPRLDGNGAVLPPGASLRVLFQSESGMEIRAGVAAIGAAPGRARLVLETDTGRMELLDTRVSGSTEELRVRPAPVPDAFARLEVVNTGPVAIRVGRLGATARPVAAPAAGVTLASRPNVVIFLTDTLRADHLGAYGHPRPTSPRFDAFSKEAILYEQAWAQSGWTKPAVASLFTGLTPGSHRLMEFTAALPSNSRTLARAFREAGFRTAGFSGNPILNARTRFDQGFARWRDTDEHRPNDAAGLVSEALAWLDAQAGPFLLYIHTFEPHWDYRPGEEHWRPFRPEGTQPYPLNVALDKALTDPTAMRWLRSAYEGEIHKNDAAFGALLDGLRQRGLLDTSVVLFTADHGDEFQDHGGLGHATTLYEEELHIPLAIRLPGALRAGARDRQPIQQIDLAPTLLRLAGLPELPDIEGRDLSARVLHGVPDLTPAEMLSEMRLLIPRKVALRIGGLKLIENDDVGRDPRSKGPSELYDLASDPRETLDLAGGRPVATAYMRSRIAALRRLHAQRIVATESLGTKISREEREQLRALGYVQ